MVQEESFRKEKIVKEDGRYLVYYDFTPEQPVDHGTKQIKGEERK